MAFSLFGKRKTEGQLTVTELPLTAIVANRFQPRTVFSPETIAELAATIKAHGLLQPIIVREYAPQQYEIIAGERRFRAMQSLGWEKAPAIVQTMTDDESASMALVENLQREGLSAIEEAKAYIGLMQLNHWTQAALAEQMGKSQAFIANKVRLLKLSDPVQTAILNQNISERHGRELLKLDAAQQEEVLEQIRARKLTVKETAALVARITDQATKPQKRHKSSVSQDTRVAWNTLKRSIKMIRDAGMTVKATEEDTDEVYRMTIEIPKHKG